MLAARCSRKCASESQLYRICLLHRCIMVTTSSTMSELATETSFLTRLSHVQSATTRHLFMVSLPSTLPRDLRQASSTSLSISCPRHGQALVAGITVMHVISLLCWDIHLQESPVPPLCVQACVFTLCSSGPYV